MCQQFCFIVTDAESLIRTALIQLLEYEMQLTCCPYNRSVLAQYPVVRFQSVQFEHVAFLCRSVLIGFVACFLMSWETMHGSPNLSFERQLPTPTCCPFVFKGQFSLVLLPYYLGSQTLHFWASPFAIAPRWMSVKQ